MANVGFKLGTQQSANNIINQGYGAVEGSFYLTSDTHRLYIGAKSGDDTYVDKNGETVDNITLFAVNEGVTKVNSIKDLPDYTNDRYAGAGRFYYAMTENILCVWTGQKWVQINPDTDTKIVESQSKWEFSETDDLTKITLNIVTSNTDSGELNVPHRISYNLLAKNGIAIGIEDDVLVLEGDTYNLDHSATDNGKEFSISLSSDKTDNDSTIKFKTANSNLRFFKDENEVINLEVASTAITGMSIAPGESSQDPEKNGFHVTVTSGVGSTTSASFDPLIQIGHNEKFYDRVHFEDGMAELDVYTGDELETLLKQLNAMIYQGLMGITGDVAVDSINVAVGQGTMLMKGTDIIPASIGDTYMAVTEMQYGSTLIRKGSLVICNSTDHTETDGIIPADKLTLDIVEMTANQDTTYQFTVNNDQVDSNGNKMHGIRLQSQINGGGGPIAGEFYIVDTGEDSGLQFVVKSEKKDNMVGSTETIAITHAKLPNEEPLVSTQETQYQNKVATMTIPVLSGITTDKMGHILEVETTDYVVNDTNSQMNKVEVLSEIPYEDNGAMVGSFKLTASTIGANNSEVTRQDYFNIISNSLKISKDSTHGHTAESHTQEAGLSIDMVWGSF